MVTNAARVVISLLSYVQAFVLLTNNESCLGQGYFNFLAKLLLHWTCVCFFKDRFDGLDL